MAHWMRSKPGEADPVTLEEHFERAADLSVYGDSGICRHLPYLLALAKTHRSICELGVGSGDQSTIALLAGRPNSMNSYDIARPAALSSIEKLAADNQIGFHFHHGETATAPTPTVDLLFVDTSHNLDTVEAELSHFSPCVNKTIVFHDVVAFGRRGQANKSDQGINLAIAEFLFEHPEWQVERYSKEDNGLLTLRRAS